MSRTDITDLNSLRYFVGQRLIDPQPGASKCSWAETDTEELKTPKKSDVKVDLFGRPIKKGAGKACKKLEYSHKIEYFCGCKIHTGFLYFMELSENNFVCVCSGGVETFIKAGYYDYTDFKRLPVVNEINCP